MTFMGRIFEVLLRWDFVDVLGCIVPLILVVNAWVFFSQLAHCLIWKQSKIT